MCSARRNFLQQIGLLSGGMALGKFPVDFDTEQLASFVNKYCQESATDLAKNEQFWRTIRQAFTVSRTFINLNNAGISPQPLSVQTRVERIIQKHNEIPGHYRGGMTEKERPALKRKLAAFAGCSPSEIAIHRNAGEALQTIIFGLRLNRGDEVVACRQDYPAMIDAWNQRVYREGIKVNWVDLQFPIADDDKIVKAYVDAMTPNTKAIHLTHLINWNGRIMPVKRIIQEARKRNLEIIVDGAQSFAHLDFKIPELDCDYFGTSLHKWLCAPFGTGMLYVKKEKIAGLYPLFASENPDSDNIDKFEHLGTRCIALEFGIAQAIEFHQLIGSERKQARLQHLKNYWTRKVAKIPGIKFGVSLKEAHSCGIAIFSMKDVDPRQLHNYLAKHYKIYDVVIQRAGINGIRISPQVYTLEEELDVLVDALSNFKQN